MTKPVVVVGSGIIGAAVALRLQEQGMQTVLLGDYGPQGASFSSFASLTAFGEPLPDVYRLKCLGMARWRRWKRRFGAELGVTWDGEVRWAESEQAGEDLRLEFSRATRRGYGVRSMSVAALRERFPGARVGELSIATLAEQDGQADPPQAILTLSRAFQDAGGIRRGGRAHLVYSSDSVGLFLGDERIEASRVVVASGAETAALLGKLGWGVPLDPSPGLLAITGPVADFLKGTVYVTKANGPAVHLRQTSDGGVLIGERSQNYGATRPTRRHARDLLQQASRSFPQLTETDVERCTLQWRPMPRDGMPIIGPLAGLSDVYVATAHSGVTLAPAIGELVASELIGEEPEQILTPFRPTRFARREAEVAVELERVLQTT